LDEQYRALVTESLEAILWTRVIKTSDFTDNAVGLIHTTGPKLTRLAGKYAPLVAVLRGLILHKDTPLTLTSRRASPGASTPPTRGSPPSGTLAPARDRGRDGRPLVG
jgi:hypothetical protein